MLRMMIVNITVEVEEKDTYEWDYEYYAVLKFNEHTAMKFRMEYGRSEEDALYQIAEKLWNLTSKNED